MASVPRSRIGQTAMACLLAATLAVPLGAALVPPADPEPRLGDAACPAEAAPEPVRVRFWIGAFEFSLALGGQAGFALAFEGLR